MPDYGDDKGFQGSGSGEASTGVGDKDAASRSRDQYNRNKQITETNPYGEDGFFSRVFGIDPKNISYANTMSLSTRQQIANNQFSKFVNPTNDPNKVGFNKQMADLYGPTPTGQLRPGVQQAGYETMLGPVMSQYAEQSTPDMVARGIMGLLSGPVGLAVGQIGTQEYGLPGQPGFESFDPNNPRGPQSFLGNALSALTGGVDPTQAAAYAAQTGEQLVDFFTPDQPAPNSATTQTQQTAPNMPAREIYAEQRGRQNALLSGIFGMGTQQPSAKIENGLTGFQTTKTPTGYHSVQRIGDMTRSEAEAIRNSIAASQGMTDQEAADAAMAKLNSGIISTGPTLNTIGLY